MIVPTSIHHNINVEDILSDEHELTATERVIEVKASPDCEFDAFKTHSKTHSKILTGKYVCSILIIKGLTTLRIRKRLCPDQ